LPHVISVDTPSADPISWLELHRSEIDERLLRHGAVLFRGLWQRDLDQFERLLEVLFNVVIRNYGDLPPESGMTDVYASTPYPADRAILFHNESSHMSSWPTRQVFGCVVASPVGGETPLVDCRRVHDALSAQARDAFARKGLLYVRQFIPGFDVSWQDFFKTRDRDEVVHLCRTRGANCQWKTKDLLMIAQPAPAIVRHPVTGERAFFNQIMLHHPFYLRREERETIRALCGRNLPRQVLFGDGTDIDERFLAALPGIYERESAAFLWAPGDFLLLDNMLVAHGRRPFEGPRKIVVGLGNPFTSGGRKEQ
jgi:alpha-ketoglutarate-dependent taurine dioxygenase